MGEVREGIDVRRMGTLGSGGGRRGAGRVPEGRRVMPEMGHMLSRLPVPTFRDGSVGGVGAHFASDGSSLWLQTSVEVMDASRWIALYGANLAAPLLALVVLWVLWKGHGAKSRPQEPGKAHCPKCSYKVLPPLVTRDARERFVAAAGTICPECGVDLRKRRPVEGEAFLSRMWILMAFGSVVGAACTIMLGFTLVWRAAALGPTGPTWPVRGLEKGVPSWPVSRRAGDWPPQQATRIERWNVETGTRRGVVAEDLRPRGVVKMSPDRKRMGVAETDGLGRTWVTVVDLERDRTERREIKGKVSKAPWVGAEVLCFSGDGGAVWVGVTETRASGIGGRVSLWRFDADTMEGTRVDDREIRMQTGTGGLSWPSQAYRVHDRDGLVRWVHVSAFSSSTTRLATEAELVWADGAGEETRTVTVDPPTGAMWGWFEFAEDGRAFDLRMQGSMGVWMRLDLERSEVGMVPAGAMTAYASFDGRYEAKVQASGLVEVVERGAGAVLWSFQGTAGSYPLAVSDDGRRVAMMNMTGGTVGVEVWERGR